VSSGDSAARPALPIDPDGVLGTDYPAHEVAIATAVALSVPFWASVLLTLTGLDHEARAPAIVPTEAIPVRVMPVLDLESPKLLKLGGGKKKLRAKLPERWKKPEPRPEKKVVERKAHVSTKAKDDPDEIPPEDLEVSDAGTEPDPDAMVVAKADIELDEDSDAGDLPEGPGSPAGSREGTETDPLKGRAMSQYHGRILRFLRGSFRVQGTGLSKEVLTGCRPSASVRIGADGTVLGFSLSPCGQAPIDAAARAAIQAKVGQSIPPPPENYPELRPNSISVTYVCSEKSCN
jgi:hypothetical protein